MRGASNTNGVTGFVRGSRMPWTPGATASQSTSASVRVSITATSEESVGAKPAFRFTRWSETKSRGPTRSSRSISGMPSASASPASDTVPVWAPVVGSTIQRSADS